MYVVLLLSASAAWAMIGLIWLIQVVHYPMLALYSEALPAAAASDHARRITPVVGPLMAVEGLTALVLMVKQPDGVPWQLTWLAAALLGVALVCTAAFSVPQHSRLAAGHDPIAAARLIQTNWYRTAAWSSRGVVLLIALALAR